LFRLLIHSFVHSPSHRSSKVFTGPQPAVRRRARGGYATLKSTKKLEITGLPSSTQGYQRPCLPPCFRPGMYGSLSWQSVRRSGGERGGLLNGKKQNNLYFSWTSSLMQIWPMGNCLNVSRSGTGMVTRVQDSGMTGLMDRLSCILNIVQILLISCSVETRAPVHCRL
jgi:hypothetical protein